jgi:ABC-2 type transport system permease protein
VPSVPDLGHSFRVAAALVRASLAAGLQYRTDFLLDAALGLLRSAAAVGPTVLLFSVRSEVAGWTAPDVTLVLGFYLVMHAILSGLVEPNLGEVVESIRSGNFDLVLLKPADAQLLVSFRRIQPSAVWDLAGGALVVAWAVAHRRASTPGELALAAGLVAAGLVAMYSLWVLAICTSFFFVRVDNLRYVLGAVADAGRNPLPVYPGWARVVLTAVVPVGLITTFPASALRGEADFRLLALATAIACAFAVLSRQVWRRSLAAYTSSGS